MGTIPKSLYKSICTYTYIILGPATHTAMNILGFEDFFVLVNGFIVCMASPEGVESLLPCHRQLCVQVVKIRSSAG